jgi:broad specificity phosphatase PhoE
MNPDSMKKVYFLRHGQTDLNKTWLHQYPDTQLSERGMEQAETAGEYFKNVKLDLIVYSPLLRTEQTAKALTEHHTCKTESNALFEELRRPRALWGMHWLHPRSLGVMGTLYFRAGEEGWHYSDEENLQEFHARARRALEWLAARPEEKILVVTHKGFMANMAERMRRDGLDTTAQYRRALWKNFAIGNCCYISATWTPEGESRDTLTGTWSVEPGVRCTS